ncbi:uncharacterized protein LOC114518010 isoform X2 [Dendronephthya gigantea]|uniref:uncharacterized protein LOC114518010 isoform X2 n=1 Tax=Dendronephthya gigantea TaxID=151771 RepID=UPI00106CEB4B|nr:uncharacterized protein LOC114518010 isoform X2 [Dendronephthya gigantea]
MIMEKNERIIAITRILPGLEAFLREVLANENLSPEAEKQRLGFVKELEQLTKPPNLPPRPTNLKTQSRASVDSIDSVENDNDFASVQRKLSNIFYLRRDFDELNEHFANGFAADETNKGTTRKVPAKVGKKTKTGKGIYEPLPGTGHDAEPDLEPGVISEEEASRIHNRSLARGTQIRQSLSRGKWFAKKEKSTLQEVFACDLQLPTISGHLMEVRTNKRRWCVLKDQHLYIFKTVEEPALFQIALPGCDISTVPKSDKTKVSYSFKITQNGVAAVILGIEEEKDLSAWMNALITASVSKNSVSPPGKTFKSLPRATPAESWTEEAMPEDASQTRRHTVGSKVAKESYIEVDIATYEKPADLLGLGVSLDTTKYNPPLPPLPGEITNMLGQNGDSAHTRPLSKYSGIYEEVGEEFILKHSMESHEDLSGEGTIDENHGSTEDVNNDDTNAVTNHDDVMTNGRRGYSEVATSDSEYSSDDDELKDENGNKRLFHDRWAVHSGVLYQKRQTGWNRRYCKIVDDCLRGFRNPNDLDPVLELNLSACNVRAAEAEGKRRFIFQLNTAESESLYFNTDSQDSLERWIEVISVAATSRRDLSVAISEDELDVGVGEETNEETADERNGSRESIPSPVPERRESLRKRDAANNNEENVDQKRESLSNKQYDKPEKLIADTGSKPSVFPTKPKAKDDQEIWRRRDPHPSYATTPRAKPGLKITKSTSVEESYSNDSLSISENPLNSPQKALQLSTKRKCSERLKKYLDQDGQFSGFILELRVKKNSTTLTRRWAVVQNGFLRIYENYGCAAPFLRISLVEAFLKDFSNIAKSRFCFMLEYGAGQSILFQTNTHQELKRWINVITLTIACHTDLFGSGLDLTQRERIADEFSDGLSSPAKSKQTKFDDEVDGPVMAPPSAVCECDHDDEEMTCTPTVVREVIHHKSYSMSSNGHDSDDVIARKENESFTYRTSLVHKVKHRGSLRVLQKESREGDAQESRVDSGLKFCELKGSLFSIYENEKSEKPSLVFNLLYDRYRQVANETLAFTLTSDHVGTVEFTCESEENFKAWKQVINNTALQDCNSDLTPNTGRCGKCSSDSPIVRKRASLRASFAEEEAKHHEVLRSLSDSFTHCDRSPYSCYVYEVRDSSGNKTIIRRWCTVGSDVIRIFERETSREAVVELHPSAYRLKDIDNPRGFPFAFKLQRLQPQEGEDGFLVIQASNAKDFRELLLRIKSIQSNSKKLISSKSETNINLAKKPQLLTHSKSDLSLKRIFALARRSSKDNLVADASPPGHDTWPKVIRRERKSSRRALSDTSTDRPVTNSLIENLRDKSEARTSMGCFLFDSEGKFGGYLTEVRDSALCRSEVRKWCVVQNDKFLAFDDKNEKSPCTVIDLTHHVQLVDLSRVNSKSFELRMTSDGDVQSHVFRAADDYQKWVTVLALAIDLGQKGGKRSQSKSPENGSVPGISKEGKTAFGKPPRVTSSPGTSSEVPKTMRKYGRKGN